jgi:hypothetical protein
MAFLASPAIGDLARLHDAAVVDASADFSVAPLAVARDQRRRSWLSEGEGR